MMLYNTTWNDSKTKKIYNATRVSEILMEYLESQLMNSGIVEMIGENPVPDKGREYGVMVYYHNAKRRRRLLSAAPRRTFNHIHIVIFSFISRELLIQEGFTVGEYKDPNPDVKINSKEEIDKLILLISKY